MAKPIAELPGCFRFDVWWNKILPRQFVPENFVLPIYHMEHYDGVRGPGPGFFRVSGWTERTGPLVSIAPHFNTHAFDDIPTCEGVQVVLHLYLGFDFDPRLPRREIAMQLVPLGESIQWEIFKRVVRGALMQVVPTLDAWSLATGKAFPELQNRVCQVTPPALQFVGMTIRGCQVQRIVMPQVVRDRLEQSAQRGINIDRSQQYHPSEIAQALFIETIERLNVQNVEYMNLGGSPLAPPSSLTHAIPPQAPPPNIPPPSPPPNIPPPQSSTPPPPNPPTKPSHLDDPSW